MKFQYDFFIFYIFLKENSSLIHYVFQITYTIHRKINFSFTIKIIIIIYLLEFFTATLTDGHSLELSDWSLLKPPGLFSVFWPFSKML